MKKVIAIVHSKFIYSMNLRTRTPQLVVNLLVRQYSAEVLHGSVQLIPAHMFGVLSKFKQLRKAAIGKGD